MSRRVVIGNVPGLGFKMRAAFPGYDAATAPLNGLIFDADYVPGRIIGSGSGQAPPQPRTHPDDAAKPVSFGHGLGRVPDMMIVVAQALAPANGAPDPWGYLFYAPELGPGWRGALLGNANMDYRYVAPFNFQGNNKGGQYQSGLGGYYFGGWDYTFDASSLVIWTRVPQILSFIWVALEL